MKSIAALFLSLCHHRGCTVDAFFLLPTFPSPPASVTPSTTQHQLQSPSCRTHQSSSSIPTLFSSTSPFSTSKIERRIVPSSVEIAILGPMGNGTFGEVYFARDEATGQALVAKAAKADTPNDTKKQQSADAYLEIEAYVNSKLYHNNTTSDDDDNDSTITITQHVAPYLGECEVNGTAYLIWEASGEYTLEDYVEMEDGWVQLAVDLGLTGGNDDDDGNNGGNNDIIGTVVEEDDDGTKLESSERQQLHNRLAAEVLRQILEGLAYCHSCGIVHRDIKPANILVDPKTRTLRLIDFGSACCMSSWSANKLGYKGENKGPRSILYCAPEEFVDEKHPYAFDLYGAAVTWIRTVLSDDIHGEEGCNDDAHADNSTTLELGDEDELFKWRIDIRNFGHNLVAWEEYATLHNSLPHGWDSLFGSSRQGIQALRLLSNMMSYSPEIRMSAAEALVGQYLNPGCDAEPPPELPPAMPFSIMSHIQRWKKDKEVHGGECLLEDLFTRVIAVELEWPLGLQLGPKVAGKSGGGVQVTGVVDGTAAAKLDLCEGDSLLAIGSIDVEDASIEHVMELLEQWPQDKHVTMLLVRDDD